MKLLCVYKPQKWMQKHGSSRERRRNLKWSRFIHLASEWMLVGSSGQERGSCRWDASSPYPLWSSLPPLQFAKAPTSFLASSKLILFLSLKQLSGEPDTPSSIVSNISAPLRWFCKDNADNSLQASLWEVLLGKDVRRISLLWPRMGPWFCVLELVTLSWFVSLTGLWVSW